MTAAEQLLARLDALRVQVRFAPETGKLRVRPSALVPPGLRQEIIDQADELIALVVTRLSPNWTDPAPASPADMPLSDPRPDLGRTRAAEIKMRSEPTNQLWRTDKWPNRRSPSPRTHNPMENTGTRWSPRGQLSPDVAAELRAFRRAREVSLRRLGRAAGVSVGFLSELERGLKRPRSGTVWRIDRVLDFHDHLRQVLYAEAADQSGNLPRTERPSGLGTLEIDAGPDRHGQLRGLLQHR